MKTPPIYLNDWLRLHPYSATLPTDSYFVSLARELYKAYPASHIPEHIRVKLCLYVAAYLEDQISGLGLWQSFTAEHKRLYGTCLPFYQTGRDYLPDEVNREDICFIVWNTWQKVPGRHPYINPLHPDIERCAEIFYNLLSQAYEEAPENNELTGFLHHCKNAEEGEKKQTWLFGHTYLTEPSMLPYIEHISPADKYIIPTGPLALFLHEWIQLLSPHTDVWKSVKGLFTESPIIPQEICKRNEETYRLFTDSTQGCPIIYLNGYEALHRFLVDELKWPDDENHTLPQMKGSRNFVLMTEPRKGILLAKDICEYIADEKNALYNRQEAEKHAFRLLTEETLCPPDLLNYCIRNNYLPDACLPGNPATKELVQRNADFIARHSLLYYYRGD